MQFRGQGKPATGVLYNTTMKRADSALALAILFGMEGKNEVRIGAIAVNGSGLGAAAFCDAVGLFYAGPGPISNSNRTLPVGLAAEGPLPDDTAMVRAVVDRRDEKGEFVYRRTINRVSDTSELPALIRNALTAQADLNAVVILSAPATYLARAMDLPGTRDLIKAKVRTLVIVESGSGQDIAAARRVLANWPTPMVLCGREIGESLPFPGASIDKDFAWSPAHPVADAYRAYRPMPYDTPSWDMAGLLYAAGPHAGLFQTSEPGTIRVEDDGAFVFAASGGGKDRTLIVDPAQRDKIIQTYVEAASAKPVPRRQFGRPPQNVQTPVKAAEEKAKP